MKEVTITEQNIQQFVDHFYSKVKVDSDLGPIFQNAIERGHSTWNLHLEKMYAFWSAIMLDSKRYKGNPLQIHRELPPFDKKLFDRWLKLFADASNESYIPEIAEQYIAKSRRIAERLKYGIYGLFGSV